jgi:hypothetical protein
MNRFSIAGATWLAAAAFAIAITFIFRIDQVQWVITFVLGVVAAALGLWLIARPSALVVAASNVVAIVWAVVYAVLTAQQFGEVAAWTTDVALIAVGAVAGLVANRAAASANLRGTIS